MECAHPHHIWYSSFLSVGHKDHANMITFWGVAPQNSYTTNFETNIFKFMWFLGPSDQIRVIPHPISIQIMILKRFVSKCTRMTNCQLAKGSRHERKVQFFETLFKRALTPTPPFVWTLCGEFFWRNFNKCAFIDKISCKSMVKMSNLDQNLDNLTLYLGHF